jgi:hypothetical protein
LSETVGAVKVLVSVHGLMAELVRIDQVTEAPPTNAGSATAGFEVDYHSREVLKVWSQY